MLYNIVNFYSHVIMHVGLKLRVYINTLLKYFTSRRLVIILPNNKSFYSKIMVMK